MSHNWTADLTNDPAREFSLCIDISLNGEHRATILRTPEGELLLRWYTDKRDVDVPVSWLLEVLRAAQHDIS